MAKKRKIKKGLNRLVQAMTRFMQKLTSEETYRILRTALVTSKKRGQAGFVLPTTTLLILVMLLVVSALMFRSYQRSSEVIGEYQKQQLENAAAPAIERARAKLERLFDPDNLPSGIPAENDLENTLKGYDLPNETPLTLSAGGGGEAPAWMFQTDTNGDGDYDDPEDLRTVYTILVRSERNGQSIESDNLSDADKVNNLLVSNGPIIQERASEDPTCTVIDETGNEVSEGWVPLTSASLTKNFQVYAISIPNRMVGNSAPSNPIISTLQYQQDRYYDQGNKWGAWFRTDFEIYPGPAFNWNGAMHTEGSMFVKAIGGINSFLISSKSSCFYEPKLNSDITLKNHVVSAVPAAPDLDSDFKGPVNIDLFGTIQNDGDPAQSFSLDSNSDSVDLSSANNAINIAMDPQQVLLDPGANQPRSNNGWTATPEQLQQAQSQISDKERIRILSVQSNDTDEAAQSLSCPPKLDDVYRADDRFGPPTGYSKPVRDPISGKCTIERDDSVDADFDYGGSISDLVGDADKKELLLRNEPPSPDRPNEYGYDGYWERRARAQGTRIIVGQRLELGNTFGWVRDLDNDGTREKDYGDDPLNPFDPTIPYSPMNGRQNEFRQRKTLYDNLAAVQATAVYHHKDGSQGYYPSAYVATTVHPGTPQTLQDSATFEEITFKDNSNQDQTYVAVDFFSGKGTNGWEFEPFFEGNESEFADEINGATPLRRALENLANFAGDPNGAFPAAPPPSSTADLPRYPSPQLTMWGDYSNLRRIMEDLQSGAHSYPGGTAVVPGTDLSIADQSTLHTAAATLGMLAYNINYLQSYDYENNQTTNDDGLYGTSDNGLQRLADDLWELQDGTDDSPRDGGTGDNYEVVDDDDDDPATDPNPQTDPNQYNLPPEAYIARLQQKYQHDGTLDNDEKEVLALARFIMLKEQVKRDRTYGFKEVSDAQNPANASTFDFEPTRISSNSVFYNQPFDISCDVTQATGNSYFGLSEFEDPANSSDSPTKSTASATDEERLIALSRLCSNEPKFPSLYYIFPKVDHDHNGANNSGSGGVNHTQPSEEPYIDSTYIASTANAGVEYQVLDSSDPDDLSAIVLQPRKIDFSDWVLPNNNGPSGDNPNSSSQELVLADGSLRQVAIKDSALYDGRENMSVRVLNLDINMLRQNQNKDDFWIPAESGIVYAFREDAVREDALARPESIDPYVDLATLGGTRQGSINTKSVDYYPDPDRRPFGFRFKNGVTLRREGQSNGSRGMTFVTDNPIYSQGNFNLHHDSATGDSNTIQEFTTTLNADFNRDRFYDRETRNPTFADPSTDWWRNTEIVADSITILSDNFCDGSIEDGILFAGINDPAAAVPPGYDTTRRLDASNRQSLYGCNGGSKYTSYLNQNLPNTALSADTYWLRANPWEDPIADAANGYIPTSPIALNQNGIPQTIPISTTPDDPEIYYPGDNYSGSYNEFKAERNLIRATETTANMVLVSGIIPSRPQQINGGFHNFPRLLEDWDDQITLTIQGSLIQLNFSNYATGPFDQDAWEYPIIAGAGGAAAQPQGGAPVYEFYVQPSRNWGYDVALQKAPAGPLAQRMSQLNETRDEFYREPKADDPYICKLRELPQIDYPCQ